MTCNNIRKEKAAEHCQEKSAKNFLQCIKRINNSGECLPSKIDNAQNFAEKYRLLYTKVPTDPLEIEALGKQLDSLCAKCNMRECRVTAVDAFDRVHYGKLIRCINETEDACIVYTVIAG